MQLRQIVARYGRKRQPAQYENAEAMIEFTLSVDEDGKIGKLDIEHENMGAILLGQAKNLVLRELGVIKHDESASVLDVASAGKASAALVPPAGDGKTETAPAKRTRKAVGETAPAADAKPAAAEHVEPSLPSSSGVGDIPVGDGKPAAETSLGRSLPASQQQPAAAVGDIPIGDANATAPQPASLQQVQAAGEELTAAAVQKFITACLVGKKFLPNVVLGILKNDYKVDRVYDINPPEKLAEFYAKIKKLAGE